jgi:hypothetical protein
VAGVCSLLALAAPAASARPGPKLSVPPQKLAAAFHCHGPSIANASRVPIMLVTGTGATGEQAYAIGKGAFDAYGHPVCDVDFPDSTTADIQVSVQYLVYGIRREARLAGRKVAVFGISQGGLLPRFALTYWPDLRKHVSDVLAAAGTQHGSTVGQCSSAEPCTPAEWQQAAGSHLLKALNRQPDESPGDQVGWTTVRSLNDETVQPQSGKHPTSALRGATNILIQRICHGRSVSHIGTALDSVTFGAFIDAIRHRGAAKVSRLASDVCAHPYAPGLDEATTGALLSGAGGLVGAQIAMAPHVGAEPAVRAYVKRLP